MEQKYKAVVLPKTLHEALEKGAMDEASHRGARIAKRTYLIMCLNGDAQRPEWTPPRYEVQAKTINLPFDLHKELKTEAREESERRGYTLPLKAYIIELFSGSAIRPSWNPFSSLST